MIHPDVAVRRSGLRRLGVIVAAARAMGTGLVTLCTGTRDAEDQWRYHPGNGSPEAWRDLQVEMEQALATAERHGIDLGIEPELANVVSSAQLALKLIGEMKSERLRIVLDPANLFEVASDRRAPRHRRARRRYVRWPHCHGPCQGPRCRGPGSWRRARAS